MIVQRILRDHGGQIEIETRPGQGTTVTLLLPRIDNRIRLLGQQQGDTPA
jgi:signal transduction histidine kinase